MRTDSLGIAMGGTTGQADPLPDLPLRRADGSPNDCAGGRLRRDPPDADGEHRRRLHRRGLRFSGTRAFDQRTGYRSQSFLTVPMKNHEGEVIGVLQLINAIDPDTGEVVPFSGRRPEPGRIARLAGGHRADQPAAHRPAGASCSNPSSS
jgi:hypothetical protein